MAYAALARVGGARAVEPSIKAADVGVERGREIHSGGRVPITPRGARHIAPRRKPAGRTALALAGFASSGIA